MFLVDINEVRNGNVHFVHSIDKFSFFLCHVIFEAFIVLVVLDRLRHWVRDLSESLPVFIENKLLL